jgi:hypothetical protein
MIPPYTPDCGCPGDAPAPVFPLPPVPPECQGGERCAEVVDAACVAYTGLALTHLQVPPQSRLDWILRQLNALVNLMGKTAGIFRSTASVKVSGEGSLENPITLDVLRREDSRNLLSITPQGLDVRITDAEIVRILAVIKSNATVRDLFCELISATSGVCGESSPGTGTGAEPAPCPAPSNLVLSTSL